MDVCVHVPGLPVVVYDCVVNIANRSHNDCFINPLNYVKYHAQYIRESPAI
jgi:hypothetical protein